MNLAARGALAWLAAARIKPVAAPTRLGSYTPWLAPRLMALLHVDARHGRRLQRRSVFYVLRRRDYIPGLSSLNGVARLHPHGGLHPVVQCGGSRSGHEWSTPSSQWTSTRHNAVIPDRVHHGLDPVKDWSDPVGRDGLRQAGVSAAASHQD
jgi:hypothetical protein